MPSFRTFGLFAFLTCLTALSLAQVSSFVNPEEIDIYSFDPSAQLKDAPTSYTAKGYEAYSKADYETAAQYYLAHLQSNPTDAGSWYNLSCCFGLLGKSELAAKYLQMAYKNGFRDLDHISRDSDFDKVVAYEEATKAFSTLEAAGFNPNNALETPPKRKVLHIFTYHNDLRSSTKPNQGWRIICNRVNQARASKRVKSKLSLAQN